MFATYLAQDKHGIMYTDLTGPFLVTSISRNKYILVIHIYDANVILLRPLKNCSDQETLAVYNDVYFFLKSRNYQLTLHILDSDVSKKLKRMTTQQKRSIKFC